VTAGAPSVSNGAASIPLVRFAQGQNDLLIETRTASGDVVDQFVAPMPVSLAQPAGTGGTGGAPSTSGSAISIRFPFANLVASILVRDAAGVVKSTVDLTQPRASFCAGQGSQECDFESSVPLRTVAFPARHIYSPLPSALSDVAALPPSPRANADEFLIDATKTTDPLIQHARQPSIAMDKDGNAVVVWRQGFKDIMAVGIDTNNAVTFGPLQINDQPCVAVGVLHGYPVPPDLVCEEVADATTHRPVVARAADGTFAVAWGTILACSDGGQIPFLCGRVMSADGKTGFSAPKFISQEVDAFTHVDVAIDNNHNFIATWFDPFSSHARVRAQRFDAYGNSTPPASAPLVVSDQDSFDALWPTVAMARDGRATIAWLRCHKDSGNWVTDDVRFQSFNSDFTKLGSVVSAGTGLAGQGSFAGITDVAMNPSSGRISLVGRTDQGAIWNTAYEFGQTTPIFDPFQVNSRANQNLQRPTVAATNNGDIMVAWLDDVGSGSSEVMPISAQVYNFSTEAYNTGARPLDVDFTASAQTLLETRGTALYNSTDSVFLNPDFIGNEAFAFQLAASDANYALTWQTSKGIVVQRLTGGPFSCPQVSGGSCGNAVPLRINGSPAQNIDIAFFPGVIKDQQGSTWSKYSTPFGNTTNFAQTAVRLIVNGYFANDIMRNNQANFNFYYDMDEGYRTAFFDGDPSNPLVQGNVYTASFSDDWGLSEDPAAQALVNVVIVVMRNLYRYESGGPLENTDPNPLVINDGGMSPHWLPVNGAGLSFIHAADDYKVLLHESGHAIFGLRDEYSYTCNSANPNSIPDTRFDDTVPDPNVFHSQAQCQLQSTHPTDCHDLTNCNNGLLWAADAKVAENQCDMASAGGYYNSGNQTIQYDLDCQRRANEIVAQPWK
jgi:hypothetical protein